MSAKLISVIFFLILFHANVTITGNVVGRSLSDMVGDLSKEPAASYNNRLLSTFAQDLRKVPNDQGVITGRMLRDAIGAKFDKAANLVLPDGNLAFSFREQLERELNELTNRLANINSLTRITVENLESGAESAAETLKTMIAGRNQLEDGVASLKGLGNLQGRKWLTDAVAATTESVESLVNFINTNQLLENATLVASGRSYVILNSISGDIQSLDDFNITQISKTIVNDMNKLTQDDDDTEMGDLITSLLESAARYEEGMKSLGKSFSRLSEVTEMKLLTEPLIGFQFRLFDIA